MTTSTPQAGAQTSENAAAVRGLERTLAGLSQAISKAHHAVTDLADEGIAAVEPADVNRYVGALFFALVEGERDTMRIRRLVKATSALGESLSELTAKGE